MSPRCPTFNMQCLSMHYQQWHTVTHRIIKMLMSTNDFAKLDLIVCHCHFGVCLHWNQFFFCRQYLYSHSTVFAITPLSEMYMCFHCVTKFCTTLHFATQVCIKPSFHSVWKSPWFLHSISKKNENIFFLLVLDRCLDSWPLNTTVIGSLLLQEKYVKWLRV